MYAPKVTKYIQKEDGLKQKTSYPRMRCKWCNNQLSDAQVYEYLRGKSKGNACSASCSNLYRIHGTKDKMEADKSAICEVCGVSYQKKYSTLKRKVCSIKCQGVLSSKRMKHSNPAKKKEVRDKISKSLKKIGHRPFLQGGNGRGATESQLLLYNEISKYNDSFCMEHIELTRGYRDEFKCPTHYKIDIASTRLMIAIEVDGISHNSLERKEQDKRKEQVLCLKGWKVLRFTNSQIKKELKNCVQMVLSMI